MYYVQESDNPNSILNRLNIVRLKQDKIILPIQKEKISSKKARKLAEKTKKILKKTNCHKLILSKEIKRQEDYKNYLYTYSIDIVEGKWLFGILSYQLLEYIISKKNIKKEETTVSILVNDISDPILENMKQIIKEYKRVNVVTQHFEKFKKIEEQILKQEGIMINISNNKKKSISKSKIVLNVDFPTELINQYNLQEDAIIINLRGNVKINKKRFNGININDYEISFRDREDFEYDKNNLYDKKDRYEARIFQNQPFSYIEKKLKKDQVKIVKLIGNRTII